MTHRSLAFALALLVAAAALFTCKSADWRGFSADRFEASGYIRNAVAHGGSNEGRLPARTARFHDKRVSDEVMIDKTFPVRPGERLVVDNAHSDVFIENGAGSEARVRVVLSGRVTDRSRAFFEHLNFQVEKSGNELVVATRPRGRFRGSSGRASINVFIEIPSTFDADLTTRHGDVKVEDLKGNLTFDIAHGDLEAGLMSGGSLQMTAAHGDVELGDVANEKSLFRLQHGDLAVREITGMEVQIDIQHGDAYVRDLTASKLAATTAHGDIEIERLDARPEISTMHGDIEVHLANARGGSFSARHGDIDLEVGASSGLDVMLTGPDLDIDSAYSFDGRNEKGRIDGQINGGGPELVARTEHGHIRLHSR